MEILFIRHAQSENNAKVPYGGSVSASSHPLRQPDPSITELGQRQIARLAAFLPDWWDMRADEEERVPALRGRKKHLLIAAPVGIQRLYCSAMRRALQSAAPLAAALDVPVQVRADIHEIGGIYDAREGGPARLPGLTRGEIAADYPSYELPAALCEDGWWRREVEGFAEAAERAARVAEWLHGLADEEPLARIGIVTHGGFLDLLLRELTGQPIRARQEQPGIRFSHYNTGMTRVDILRGERVVLRFQNRVPHLSAELLSY